MTHIATLGVSSCATIAIGGFKNGQRELNEAYKKDKTVPASEGMTVEEFYSKILYPTSQPLGKTMDLPFEKLMEDLSKSSMKNKFTLAVINEYQYNGNNKYWHNELKRWGFGLVSKTRNEIGSTNYIYTRAPLSVPVKPEEV